MSYWNYRVCKREVPYGSDENETKTVYDIREAYYNDDGDVWATSEEPQGPRGETVEELKNDLERFGQAFERDTINLDTFKYAKCPYDKDDLKNLDKVDSED